MPAPRYSAIIVGGLHDGLEGDVARECIELGFLVRSGVQDGEEFWHGYHLRGRDDCGRYVFMPPSKGSP